MTLLSRALRLLALTFLLTGCGGGKESADQLLIIDEITAVSATGSGSTNRFPQVRHALDKSIADSINSDLVAEVFGLEWSKSLDIFEAIRPTGDGMASVNDVSYRVIENNTRFLSLAISAEGCGAYCEPFTMHLNYDAATGRRIKLPEIFTASGLAIMADSVSAWKRKEIAAFIDEVRDDPSGRVGEMEEEYIEDMIAMYEMCLASLDEYEEDLSYAGVTIDRGAVTIYLPRCSNHAMLALDELGDFSYRIDFTRWKNYLTPYGKRVLGM